MFGCDVFFLTVQCYIVKSISKCIFYQDLSTMHMTFICLTNSELKDLKSLFTTGSGDQFKNQRNALQIIPYIPLHQRLTMLSTHFLYSSCTLYIIIYASSVFSVFLLQSLHNYLDSAACISVFT